MGNLIYIIAARRTRGLPGMEKAMEGRIYYTYAEAEEALSIVPEDIRGSCGVFSVHCIVQQETTFEVPF